jgi:hypothetical protein
LGEKNSLHHFPQNLHTHPPHTHTTTTTTPRRHPPRRGLLTRSVPCPPGRPRGATSPGGRGRHGGRPARAVPKPAAPEPRSRSGSHRRAPPEHNGLVWQAMGAGGRGVSDAVSRLVCRAGNGHDVGKAVKQPNESSAFTGLTPFPTPPPPHPPPPILTPSPRPAPPPSRPFLLHTPKQAGVPPPLLLPQLRPLQAQRPQPARRRSPPASLPGPGSP